MSSWRIKSVLVLFVVLSASLSVNLLVMQPSGGRAAAGRVGADPRFAGKPAAKVMSIAVGEAVEGAAVLGLRQAAARGDAAAAGDTAGTIKAIQRELQARGYDAGSEDGMPGLVTRAAILAFEFDYGLPLTAEPSEALLKHIIMGEVQLGSRGGTSTPTTPQAEQVIRTVQQTLSKAGYAVGKVDGHLGEETLRAIREFETDQHLPETGRVSGQLMARLVNLAGQGRLSATR